MKSEFRIPDSEPKGQSQFECDGLLIVKSFAGNDECDLLCLELTPLFEQQQKSAKNKIGGLRNIIRTNEHVSQFVKSSKISLALKEITGTSLFPIRAIFFDKTPEANWLVPWHQDLAIPVVERIETPNFNGWSVKDGVLHVHPPQEILENMLTLRLHLDDCDTNNGALKVIPGSHRRGKLGTSEIAEWVKSKPAQICEVFKGDAVFMRPLLLHASSPAATPLHRRVLHVEFAAQDLPNGLKWFNC
jgi:ectoine hydroxylase-related dioxygenase (phytanoyl-CoA dioxygenase family)